MRPCLIVALIVAVATLTASASPSLTVGDPQLLYTDAQMPFTMDGPFATLTRDSNTFYLWHTDMAHNGGQKWIGTLTNPLQTLVWTKTQGQIWNNGGADGSSNGFTGQFWLYNVYKVDSTRLLGFVHREFGSPSWFAVGLAYSSDLGDTWKYLGDVIRPQRQNAGVQTGNVGGAPYLIVGPYVHIYFNEWPIGGGQYDYWAGTARALFSDVLTAAANGTVVPFKKYSNGAWTEDGLTGLGSDIITFDNKEHDTCNDAAYNTALGQYMLLIDTQGGAESYMYLSTDGVNWNNRVTLEVAASGSGLFYASIVDLNGASDHHTVGSNFVIFYPHKNVFNYDDDQLYRVQATVGAPSTPGAPRSLQLSSLLRTIFSQLQLHLWDGGPS